MPSITLTNEQMRSELTNERTQRVIALYENLSKKEACLPLASYFKDTIKELKRHIKSNK